MAKNRLKFPGKPVHESTSSIKNAAIKAAFLIESVSEMPNFIIELMKKYNSDPACNSNLILKYKKNYKISRKSIGYLITKW